MNAQAGVYSENTYIPVRISTPGIVQERLFAEDLPMAMPVKKVIQALGEDPGRIKGKNVRGHGLTVEDVLYVIEHLDSPDYLFSQPNERGVAVLKLPGARDNTAVIVEFGQHINAPYMNGYAGGEYNISITAFDVDGGDSGLFIYQLDKGWRKVFDKQKEGDPAKKFQATRPFAIEQDALADRLSQEPGDVKRRYSERHGQGVDNTVAMTKIEADVLGSAVGKSQARSLISASEYSLPEVFSKINPADRHFLKYVPDGFLSDVQKEAKQSALREDAARIAQYGRIGTGGSYTSDVNGDDLYQQMVEEYIAQEGSEDYEQWLREVLAREG